MSCQQAQPIYWGGSADTSLDEAGVLALANTRTADTEKGSYPYEPLAGVYAYLAYPLAFGDRETFLVDGLNVHGTIETVSVNGVDYQVQRSPNIITAPDLVVVLR